MAGLTKRQFLKYAVVSGGLAAVAPLLAACGGAPASPTAAPAKATEAPKPAATTAPAAAASPTTASAAKPTVAAAKPAPAKEPVTLRFHFRSGGEKSEPAIYVQRPQEWMDETGHKIKNEPIPSGKDYIPKVEALAASNTIGDVVFTQTFQFEHNHLMKYNVLEPCDPYMGPANVKKTEWFAPVVETISQGGKMYGMPKTGHPLGTYIWINLKMFEAAGIKKPEVFGNTFDDVANWAIQLSKGPKDKRDVYGYSAYVVGIKGILPPLRSWGGDFTDKEGKVSLADTDPWLDWANWHAKLIADEKVHPLGDVVGTNGPEALFAAEKLAMLHNERSSHRTINLAVKDKFPWMAIQFPKGPNFKGWPTSVNTHSVTAASKHKEVGFSFIYALADQRFAYLMAKEQGYLAGRVDNLEAIKEMAQDPFIKLQQKCTEEMSPSWFMANFRGYEFETALLNQLDLVWLGKRKVDKAFMQETKKALDEVMSKPI